MMGTLNWPDLGELWEWFDLNRAAYGEDVEGLADELMAVFPELCDSDKFTPEAVAAALIEGYDRI
jgi:hypothetical protein